MCVIVVVCANTVAFRFIADFMTVACYTQCTIPLQIEMNILHI